MEFFCFGKTLCNRHNFGVGYCDENPMYSMTGWIFLWENSPISQMPIVLFLFLLASLSANFVWGPHLLRLLLNANHVPQENPVNMTVCKWYGRV